MSHSPGAPDPLAADRDPVMPQGTRDDQLPVVGAAERYVNRMAEDRLLSGFADDYVVTFHIADPQAHAQLTKRCEDDWDEDRITDHTWEISNDLTQMPWRQPLRRTFRKATKPRTTTSPTQSWLREHLIEDFQS